MMTLQERDHMQRISDTINEDLGRIHRSISDMERRLFLALLLGFISLSGAVGSIAYLIFMQLKEN